MNVQAVMCLTHPTTVCFTSVLVGPLGPLSVCLLLLKSYKQLEFVTREPTRYKLRDATKLEQARCYTGRWIATPGFVYNRPGTRASLPAVLAPSPMRMRYTFLFTILELSHWKISSFFFWFSTNWISLV